MVLKDWKKTKENERIVDFYNKTTSFWLRIIRNKDGYLVGGTNLIAGMKLFKTKSEALRFANEWMRSH